MKDGEIMDNLIEVVVKEEPPEMEYNYGYKSSSEKTKFINRMKRYIRTSMEYRDYIAFLRDNIGMDACAFFNNISKSNGKRVRIEVHHEPLRLHDLVAIVIEKYEQEGIPLNDMMISEEVMKLHYRNQVGLIPLSKTLHQVVHKSDKLVIPAYMIYGDYNQFVKEYGDYMDEFQIGKIEKMIEVTKDLKKEDFKCLDQKYEYIQVDGFTLPAKLEETVKKSNKEAA